MSNELFIAYWSGEEPTGPILAPTLDQTPDYVDIVPLYFAVIADDGTLDFNRLTLHNTEETIKGWMQDIRTRQQNQEKKTKFTLCILSDKFPSQDAETFAQTVKAAYDDWGVDGITIDYEPPSDDANIINVVTAIRNAIGEDAIMTAPIYSMWTYNDLLNEYAAVFDYIETMDYSPYDGQQLTIDNYVEYAKKIGTEEAPAYDKIAIGVSCMNPNDNKYTPLADVKAFCQYEPPSGTKLGIMLFTTSYDVKSHGSGYPDGTFTETINENLP